MRCFGIDSLEQLPYVELPMAQNEGEIIPLDIDIPEINAPQGEQNEENENIQMDIIDSVAEANDEDTPEDAE